MPTLLIFIVNNWRLILVAGLISAVVIQSWRLDVMQRDEEARLKAEQIQAEANKRNKERTDAQYRTDLATARAAGVRWARSQFVQTSPAGSSNPGLACFSAGELDQALTRWAGQVYERFTAIAQRVEEVAAAYRACDAWAEELGAVSRSQGVE